MEPIFEAQGVMDENRYRQFYLLHLQSTPAKTLMTVLAVVMFAISLFSVFFEMAFSAVVMLAAGICLLFWPKLTAKKYGAQMDLTARYIRNKPFTLRFFDDEIAEFTPVGEMHVRYEDVFRVVESADMLLIYISAGQAYVLFKNEITRGDAAALSAFLRNDKHISYKSV